MHARPAQQWRVFRNKRLAPDLQPLRIEESCDGKRLDYAELVLDPTHAKRMEDYKPMHDVGSQIEIEAVGVGLKHIGVITQVIPTFSPSGEVYKFVSQMRPHLFGDPIGGVLMYCPQFPPAKVDWDPDGTLGQPQGTFKLVDDDIVFNPEIDGRIFGNMHSRLKYGPNNIPVFLDPNSVKVFGGKKIHGGNAVSWTLSSAVYYLCWAMNPLQHYVNNPSLAELVKSFQDSVDLVRNVKIQDGQFLPEVLDELLVPLGYRWRVAKSRGNNRLDFFRRSTGGRAVWLNHQRFGEVFDPRKTEVEAQGIAFDAGRLANRIIGRGSKLQIEITAELCRGWLSKFDEYSRDDLKLSAITPELEGEEPGLRDAWRRWVLNEGGDYIGLRPEIREVFPPGVKARLDAAGFLQWMVPRKRRFLPTLTRDDNGEPIGETGGIQVEWTDDGGETWKSTSGLEVHILQHEAGIYLGCDEIPEKLRDAGDKAKFRVTATIEADFRITAVAERQASSPIVDVVTAVLDLDSQFHWREVTALSKYKSGNHPSLAEDDRDQLQAFVENLRERFDHLDCGGAVTLEGVDQHYFRLGDRVFGIKGKNIDFATRRDSLTYPQIASVTYDIEGQKTVLAMDRTRDAVVIG